MRNLSALLQSDSAAFNWPRNRNPVFIETQQNQGVCRILAQSPIVEEARAGLWNSGL